MLLMMFMYNHMLYHIAGNVLGNLILLLAVLAGIRKHYIR